MEPETTSASPSERHSHILECLVSMYQMPSALLPTQCTLQGGSRALKRTLQLTPQPPFHFECTCQFIVHSLTRVLEVT